MSYVYLIGTSIFGWYKIGKSATPEVRVKDLGVLLPFKVTIVSVWKAENHHMMEQSLHEMYKDYRINGEWFEFTKPQVQELIKAIPDVARVYPGTLSECLDRFSNVGQDTRKDKRVIGVRTQKLRGDFTDEERESRRISAMDHKCVKKTLEKTYRYSECGCYYQLACNKPYTEKKVKINIFTSITS